MSFFFVKPNLKFHLDFFPKLLKNFRKFKKSDVSKAASKPIACKILKT